MKYILIIFILLFIINYIDCEKPITIKANLYCREDCQGNFNEVEIQLNECKQFPPDLTCNYNVPFFTVVANPNSNQNYTVFSSYKCDKTTEIDELKKNIMINLCSTIEVYGFTFSILSQGPINDNFGEYLNNSNYLIINSILLFSILIFFLLLN